MELIYSSKSRIGVSQDHVSIYKDGDKCIYLLGNASKGDIIFLVYDHKEVFGNRAFWEKHRDELREYGGAYRTKRQIAKDIASTLK